MDTVLSQSCHTLQLTHVTPDGINLELCLKKRDCFLCTSPLAPQKNLRPWRREQGVHKKEHVMFCESAMERTARDDYLWTRAGIEQEQGLWLQQLGAPPEWL